MKRIATTVVGVCLFAALLVPRRSAAALEDAADPFTPVQWGAVTKSLAGAGTLTKIAGCDGCPDAGAVSLHQLPAGEGSVELVPAPGHRLFAGLADVSTTLPSPASLPYAFSFWPDGGWDVRERGVYKTEGRLTDGDVFRIVVAAGTVRYFRNGQLVYTSTVPAASPLRFGATLYSRNASLAAARVAVPYGGPAVTTYESATDRETRAKPLLPVPGPAGTTMIDPAFGATIRRITDARTRPDLPDRSFRTPSGTHQHAWSAGGNYFYVVGTDGTVVPYAFDSRTGDATRIQPTATDAGGMTLKFFNEAQFSYVDDAHIYATYNGGGSTLRTIDQYDFSTGLYTRLLDLDTVATGLRRHARGGRGLERRSGRENRRILRRNPSGPAPLPGRVPQERPVAPAPARHGGVDARWGPDRGAPQFQPPPRHHRPQRPLRGDVSEVGRSRRTAEGRTRLRLGHGAGPHHADRRRGEPGRP